MNELKDSRQDKKKKKSSDVIDLVKKMKNNDRIIDLTEELVAVSDEKKNSISNDDEEIETAIDDYTPSKTRPVVAETIEDVLDLTDDPADSDFQKDAETITIGSPVEVDEDADISPDTISAKQRGILVENVLMDDADEESLESKAALYEFLSDVSDDIEPAIEPYETPVHENSPSDLEISDPPVDEKAPPFTKKENLSNLLHLGKSSANMEDSDSDFNFSSSLGLPLEDDKDMIVSDETSSKEPSKIQTESLFKIVEHADEIITPVSISQEQIESALERVLDRMFSEKIEKLMYELIEKAIQKEIEEIKKSLIEDL